VGSWDLLFRGVLEHRCDWIEGRGCEVCDIVTLSHYLLVMPSLVGFSAYAMEGKRFTEEFSEMVRGDRAEGII
jgi:hypothetical protein